MKRGEKESSRKSGGNETQEIEPIEIKPAGTGEGTIDLIKMAKEED